MKFIIDFIAKFSSMAGRQELYADMVSFFTKRFDGFFRWFSRLIGSPKGMPIQSPIETLLTGKDQTVLPLYVPEYELPNYDSWSTVIWGHMPKTSVIPRIGFISPERGLGYYNFYFVRYKSMFFLPDNISEFLQVNDILDCATSVSKIEAIRESVFIGLTFYMVIVNVRTILFWFLTVNTYTIPWILLHSFVDWTDDIVEAISPVVGGVSPGAMILTTAIGILSDSLNRFVFTMPYLPSEGYKATRLVEDRLMPVIQFDGLPRLWYEHPIPNAIREYWFYDEPSIFGFMYQTYPDLQILPDGLTVDDVNPIFLQKIEIFVSLIFYFK